MLNRIRCRIQGLFFLATLLMCACTPLCVQASEWCYTQTEVFLKINKYYVPYTAPVIPYMSRNGTVMVGLLGLSELTMGKLQSVDSEHEKFTIGEHTFVFTSHSDKVDVDHQTLRMPCDTETMGTGVNLIVPIGFIAEKLNWSVNWDRVSHIYSIDTRQQLNPDGNAMDTDTRRFLKTNRNNEVLHPVSIELVHVNRATTLNTLACKDQVVCKIQNTSRYPIQKGDGWIPGEMVTTKGDFTFDVPYFSTDLRTPVPNAWKPEEIRKVAVRMNDCDSQCYFIVLWPVSIQ